MDSSLEDALWRRQISRPSLALIHLLALAPRDGATFDAIAFGLGVQIYQIRNVVKAAVQSGFVEILYVGPRRRGVVRLLERGRDVHRILFREVESERGE